MRLDWQNSVAIQVTTEVQNEESENMNKDVFTLGEDFGFAESMPDPYNNQSNPQTMLRKTFFYPIEVCTTYGSHPIHWYALIADPKYVRHCIEIGEDVNITDDYNITPLHLAAWVGHEKVVNTNLK